MSLKREPPLTGKGGFSKPKSSRVGLNDGKPDRQVGTSSQNPSAHYAVMVSAMHLGDANSGLQAGIINGPVNTEFHHHGPPGKLQRPKPTGANDSPTTERQETPPNPSVVIPFSRDTDFVERGLMLDQIHQKCDVPGSRTALVGLGGVG